MSVVAWNRLEAHEFDCLDVLSIHSRTKVLWDIFLALVTAYAVVVVPMDLTFDVYKTYHSLGLLQIAMDILFLADILLVFRTSYLVSDSREEVFDVGRIRRNYLASWFWIDCMASIPSSVLGQAFRDSDFAPLAPLGRLSGTAHLVAIVP